MKTGSKLFIALAAVAAVFMGCSIGITPDRMDADPNMAVVSFNVENRNGASRTAVPTAVNWGDYTYTLKVTDSKSVTTTLFSSISYTSLADRTFSLTVGTYSFTMEAYSGSTNVLTGVLSDVALNKGPTSLTFVMRPVADLNAEATITLMLPTYETIDGTTASLVASVKGGFATSPVADDNSCSVVAATPLSIKNSGTATPSVTLSCSTLKTGTLQFAIFYLYDSNGTLIGTIAEGVSLLYGKVSSSTITADKYALYTYPVEIRLAKNGGIWEDARKVKLQQKSDPTKETILTRYGSGTPEDPYTYTASVPNSAYYVLVQSAESNSYRNTYVALDTAQDSTRTLDYYTVNLAPGTGVDLVSVTEVTPQADGSILFLSGDSYTYKAVLKEGYDLNGGSVTISENGSAKSTSLDSNRTITISKATVISTTAAHAIEYTINYSIAAVNGVSPKWVSGSKDATVAANTPAAFKKYTVTNDFNLPTAADIVCTGKLLDGWYISGGSESQAFSTIKADTLHQNLTLVPKWKDASASTGEATSEDSSGTLSSNGISFIICDGGKDSRGDVITNIYYDINSNGVIDSTAGDTMVNIGGITNFTDYEITASSLTGDTVIASDVKFTVTGGRIYSITGLGKDAANKSILNISGNPIIGNATTTTVNINNADVVFATEAHGVRLSTFTDEIVNITGKVTSAQGSIVLLTDYSYDADVPHYVAELADPGHAESGLFACFDTTRGANGYQKKNLGKIEDKGRDVIRITNDAGISIEDNDVGIILVKNEENTAVIGFTVGEDRINTKCSVFSISSANGTFKLKQSKIYPNDSTKETGLQYLGQYRLADGNTNYEETLNTTNNYIYMHVMASNNQFTEGDASDFLSQVLFIPDTDTDGNFMQMDVKINLETIPWDQIAAMKQQAKSNVGKEEAFSYFDGSFYLGVKDANKPSWSTCYTRAKQTTFNGLKGYLMNITSKVENEYIYKRIQAGNSWIGGARLAPVSEGGDDSHFTAWDQDTLTTLNKQTYVTKFYWVSGPEAGTWFTDGAIVAGAAGRAVYGYANATVTKDRKGNITGATAKGSKVIETNGFTNWDSGEPNDSNSGNSEQCVHFYASGTATQDGKWNDYNDAYANPTVYMVEFTPYTRYNADGTVASTSGTPDAAPIKKTASFNLAEYE